MNPPFLRGEMVILCVLVAAIVIVSALVSADRNHPGRPIEFTREERNNPGSDSVDWLSEARKDNEYAVIAERNLFIEGPRKKPAQQDFHAVEMRALSEHKVAPSKPAMSVAADGPGQNGIAVVGLVTIDSLASAIIEDVKGRESRIVPLQGEFKGYQLVDVRSGEATLAKNGKSYIVVIGENKPDEASSRYVTGEALRNLTEAQRLQFRHEVPGLTMEERHKLLE